MERAVLVTGSNEGDRPRNLDRARELIASHCGSVVAESAVYESEPWGDVEGEAGGLPERFLNQALVIETALEPLDLLDGLEIIESRMGRVKKTGYDEQGPRKYRSRVIDIDIIFYGDRVIESPRLTIPHPLAGQRAFVLSPVAEAAPHYRHPVTGLTAGQMLEILEAEQ